MVSKKVLHWLQTGANALEGVQLINEACAPSFVVRQCQRNPEANRRFMVNWLCHKYGIDIDAVVPVAEPRTVKKQGFRDEFPFLNSPSCPPELEALASRKFARYHQYVELHQRLRDCASLAQCAAVSRELLTNFFENRAIWEELNYYKEHGSCLGNHPIFRAFQNRKKVVQMDIRQLVQRKRQVEYNIWRINDQLKKGDKPHLDVERRSRLFSYEQELHDINRLLGDE